MENILFDRKQYVNQLIESRHNGMIKVVTGIRRSGKSYLLFTLYRNWLMAQGVPADHIIAVDLEKRSLRNIDDSFKKIIILCDNWQPTIDDDGIVTMGLKQFLLNKDSLEN